MFPAAARAAALLMLVVGVASVAAAQERSRRPRGEPSGRAPEQAAPVRPAPRAQPGGLHYLDGLEALEAGDYRRAVEHFGRAIEADGDSAGYHEARGVAHVLAEQFDQAIADLERALRLRPNHRESRMWLGAALQMADRFTPQRPPNCFTHGPDLPPAYAEVVCHRMAMTYWTSRHRGIYQDREARRAVPVTGPVRTAFPDAARAYVARHKGEAGPAGEAVLGRMKASFQQGDCRAALRDLVALRRSTPDDPQLRTYWGACLVNTGDVWGGRRELTHALTHLPLWADGYLYRALAAASLGDERRVQADLAAAAALGAGRVEAVGQAVAARLAPRPPDDAAARLARAVEGGADTAALVEAALGVVRWMEGRRLRYDEAYQDRIRLLAEHVRDQAGSADAHDLLARFLYRHHQVPTVWNGPRGGRRPLRPQSRGEQQGELTRGLTAAGEAVRLDPRHASGLATSAVILHRLGRSGEAEAMADRSLAVEPRNVRALEVKAQVLRDGAAALMARVHALRAGRTETHTERRSDGVYEVTRHYPPTPAQLAEAAALESRAVAMEREARRLGAEARRVESEVLPALLREADARLAAGDAAGARTLLERAATCDPDAGPLVARLAEVYRRLGEAARARLHATLAEPLRHTTAAGELETAWAEASRTAWRSAGEALDRAQAIDAADPRPPAYRSVVAAGSGDGALAQRLRRGALALEEARARLMGTSFAASTGPTLEPDEIGLTLGLRQEVGTAALAARELDRALEAFGGNVALEGRLVRERLFDLLPSAMLPDPATEPGRIPEAPSLASVLAWSRLGLARALLAQGRPADARREFRAVRAYLAGWPATARGAETMNVVEAWARLGLAEAAHAARDHEEAFRILIGEGGWPGRLPEELTRQRKALEQKVIETRRRGG